MASEYSSQEAVEDFIYYKLRQKGYLNRVKLREPPINALHVTMREAGDEYEARFHQAFSDLSSQLHVTPSTAYSSFALVVDELFRGDVNWGRIVALFVFGASLCAECVNKEMTCLVSRIMEWMVTYLDNNLQEWMQHNGGWSGFVSLYGNGAVSEARKQREGHWSSVRTVLTGAVALGAVMTVGALFTSK